MTRAIKYDVEQEQPAFEQFRLTISNEVLKSAIQDLKHETGMSNKEIAREAIICFLVEEEQIQLEAD